MHRELEWPVSKATCLDRCLYTMYRNMYIIIEGTRHSVYEYPKFRAREKP